MPEEAGLAAVVKCAALAIASVLLAASATAQTQSAAPEHHEPRYLQILVDRLEYQWRDGGNIASWDAETWYGGDYDRVWFKTQGEYRGAREFERAEVQLLYSRLLGYYWDLQGGVRYDFRPNPSRTYGVIGLQGLAPGFFEVDLQAFVSDRGDVSFRLEAEYDLLITQRLVLQPRAEANLAVQRVPELGIGGGLNDLELGLRLRYEITRNVAPYVGVAWERRFGETSQLAQREGERKETWALVTGIRLAF